MAQLTFSVRMDEDLKKQFDSLCSEFGMNVSTAINVFAKAVVRERRIPFEISSGLPYIPMDSKTKELFRKTIEEMRESARKNGIQDMSLDEINAEIQEARKNL